MPSASSQSPLSPFRGPLTANEVAEGINAAIRNAKRLAADAKILLDAKRYPSAASMAALSVEESEKVSTLRAMCLARSKSELLGAWKDYRAHHPKNTAWILSELVQKGARHLSEFKDATDTNGETVEVLDMLKQLGFYTDSYRKGFWTEPSTMIDATVARTLVEIAESMCAKAEVTPREIELWVEHVGPAWLSRKMPDALMRWAKAMEKEGLAKPPPSVLEKLPIEELMSADVERQKKYKH
ncbi:MAG: AbiV family abortive infection protein [Rhodospirillaceae bacterium]